MLLLKQVIAARGNLAGQKVLSTASPVARMLVKKSKSINRPSLYKVEVIVYRSLFANNYIFWEDRDYILRQYLNNLNTRVYHNVNYYYVA